MPAVKPTPKPLVSRLTGESKLVTAGNWNKSRSKVLRSQRNCGPIPTLTWELILQPTIGLTLTELTLAPVASCWVTVEGPVPAASVKEPVSGILVEKPNGCVTDKPRYQFGL